jgi:diguanylate cyclase (GGDEF)-like protein
MWLGVSIGLVSLFINLQNESSYVDKLTGLFNRQYLGNLLSMYGERKDSGVPAGILLDIDNLKSINDRFGHVVGDEAISIAGKILHEAVGDKGVLCRYAGDEFIVFMYINSQEEIMDMIDLIKTQAALFNDSEKKPFKINFSIGYGTYESKHESIDDFLNKIDASMYEDKKRKNSGRMVIK